MSINPTPNFNQRLSQFLAERPLLAQELSFQPSIGIVENVQILHPSSQEFAAKTWSKGGYNTIKQKQEFHHLLARTHLPELKAILPQEPTVISYQPIRTKKHQIRAEQPYPMEACELPLYAFAKPIALDPLIHSMDPLESSFLELCQQKRITNDLAVRIYLIAFKYYFDLKSRNYRFSEAILASLEPQKIYLKDEGDRLVVSFRVCKENDRSTLLSSVFRIETADKNQLCAYALGKFLLCLFAASEEDFSDYASLIDRLIGADERLIRAGDFIQFATGHLFTKYQNSILKKTQIVKFSVLDQKETEIHLGFRDHLVTYPLFTELSSQAEIVFQKESKGVYTDEKSLKDLCHNNAFDMIKVLKIYSQLTNHFLTIDAKSRVYWPSKKVCALMLPDNILLSLVERQLHFRLGDGVKSFPKEYVVHPTEELGTNRQKLQFIHFLKQVFIQLSDALNFDCPEFYQILEQKFDLDSSKNAVKSDLLQKLSDLILLFDQGDSG